MEVSEVKKRVDEIEKEIFDILLDFELASGLGVVDVELDRLPMTSASDNTALYGVTLRVEL